MLTKIIAIRNVGRFLSSGLPGVPALQKFTLVFGANGSGKTTLCCILRSLGTNDPALITGRHRVGSKDPPKVELLLDGKGITFENGSWTGAPPGVLVFDGHFISENVHSGDAVDLEQKRNLYRVIIGKEGVALALQEEGLAAKSREIGSDIKVAEKALKPHIPPGMKLEDFISLPADEQIDAKITAQIKVIEAAKVAALIKSRAPLSLAPIPSLPEDIETLLAKTLGDIAEDAQRQVTQHIERHELGERAEGWIAEGASHLEAGACPFCGQSVSGLSLIEAYRKIFSEGYRALKAQIEDMHQEVEQDLGDRASGALSTLFEANRAGAEFWGRYCKLPALNVQNNAAEAMSALKTAVNHLLSKKAAAPQEHVPIDSASRKAMERFQNARTDIEAYNAAVSAANIEIAAKKLAAETSDLKKEESTLTLLTAQKKRHDAEVDPLCSDHERLTKLKTDTDARKAEVRAKLEDHTDKVIKPYEARINDLLDSFNAGFSIAQTKPAYTGGVASSTYQLVINHIGIELGDGQTPVDRPSFKNTLSAGDRSTLALALFLAHLERDPDRSNKIVVFDDPFTSQDSFRRRQTGCPTGETRAGIQECLELYRFDRLVGRR